MSLFSKIAFFAAGLANSSRKILGGIWGAATKEKNPGSAEPADHSAAKAKLSEKIKAMLERRRTTYTGPRLFGNGRLNPRGDGAKSRQRWGKKARRQAQRNKNYNPNWSSKAVAGKWFL